MLNRAAEQLFWIGRYMERIQNHTRLIQVGYHMRHELNRSTAQSDFAWERLLESFNCQKDFYQDYAEANEKTVLHYITFDSLNINSIYSCIKHARTNAHAVRDKLPSESWETLNALYLWMQEKDIGDVLMETPYLFFQKLKEWIALFNNSLECSMLRQSEWHVLQMGISIERSENMVRMLRSIHQEFLYDSTFVHSHDQYHKMCAFLKSLNAYEGFRTICANDMQIGKIVEFLMGCDLFPRSYYTSLITLETHLKALQQLLPYTSLYYKAAGKLEKLISHVTYLEWSHLSMDSLQEMLNDLLLSSNEIGALITRAFSQEEMVRV
ncbi:alpha-E domain-containing protein [Bacillus sp. 03113]|uniref:alpha-E domain-containing protein n=1 Tax=Bacillus sp. 03113 TaxID=2578211 RepID=UPI0011411A42|nr:alpha-E domain-containing protein [Bacillus sp. 03113]